MHDRRVERKELEKQTTIELRMKVAYLRNLLARAWDFPDYPSSGEGLVSTPEVWDEKEKWAERWSNLNKEIQLELPETD